MAESGGPIRYRVEDFPPLPLALLQSLQLVIVIALPLVYPVLVLKAAKWSLPDIQNALSWGLFSLAAGAALQALPKGPVGAGYLCPPLPSAIYLHPSLSAAHFGGAPLAFGMTVFSGVVEILFGGLVRRLRFLFPGEVCGLVVLLVGLEIGQNSVRLALDFTDVPLSAFGAHTAIMLTVLAMILGMTIWGNLYLRNIAPIAAVFAGTVLAVLWLPPSSASQAFVASTPWVAPPRLPQVSFAFELGLVVPFLATALAAALRTLGVATTLQQLDNPHWRSPNYRSLAGAVRADGLGAVLAGLVGFLGTSSAPSAIGVSTASGTMSRRLAFVLAGWLVLLAFLPRVLAMLCTAPTAVVAALLMFYSSFMIVGGLRLIGRQSLDMRATFVLGVSLTVAFSSQSVRDPLLVFMPLWLKAVVGSMLTTGMVTAVFLTLLFRVGIRRQETFHLQINDEAPTRVSTEIGQRAQQLGARAQVVRDAAALSATVIRKIHDHGLASGEVGVSVSYDRVTLKIEFDYAGKPLNLSPYARPTTDDLVDENVFSSGLSSYLDEVYPDDFAVKVSDGRVKLTLGFEVG